MADHGIQITRTTISPPPVAVIGQGIVGVVGTAPDVLVTGAFGTGTAINYNEPYTLYSRADAPSADLGAGGTLPDALNAIYRQGNVPVQMVIVEESSTDATQRTNLLGTAAALSGIYALQGADPIPKVLCIGHDVATDRTGGNANTLAAGLVEVAGNVRGVAVLDGPNGTQAEAITFAGDFDSARAFLVDPGVNTADGEVLASPSVAGLVAVTDFWRSPSNRVLNGVVGTQRKIDFQHGNSSTRAQALNDEYIATIIRLNGYRLWGNETVATTAASYRFLNIQRTADSIEDSLEAAHLWAIDRNITVRYFELVAQSVNNFLDKLTAQGAITGGICYPDDSKNTVAAITAGEVYFQVEWSGAYPAQTLNINMELSGRFLEELLANI